MTLEREIRLEAKNTWGVNSLLSIDRDPKTHKSNELSDEYLTAIQYFAPATLAGVGNACPWATPGCVAGCLHTAGNPVYLATKEKSRIARTRLYFGDRELYKALLIFEIRKAQRAAKRVNRKLALRLNGTSDVAWERVFPSMFDTFTECQFCDYTKGAHRMRRELPPNYDLTFSRSENNHNACLELLAMAKRVAVVFSTWRDNALPRVYEGFRVHNGDKHDMTFLRPSGWLGLRAKGKSRRDNSGFVVQLGV